VEDLLIDIRARDNTAHYACLLRTGEWALIKPCARRRVKVAACF